MLLSGSLLSILNIYTCYLLLSLSGNKLLNPRDRPRNRMDITSGIQDSPFPHLHLLSDHGQSFKLPEPWSHIKNIRTRFLSELWLKQMICWEHFQSEQPHHYVCQQNLKSDFIITQIHINNDFYNDLQKIYYVKAHRKYFLFTKYLSLKDHSFCRCFYASFNKVIWRIHAFLK